MALRLTGKLPARPELARLTAFYDILNKRQTTAGGLMNSREAAGEFFVITLEIGT